MTHYDANSRNDAAGYKSLQPGNDVGFLNIEPIGDHLERTGYQRQSIAKLLRELPVEIIDPTRRYGPILCAWMTYVVRLPRQSKPQIYMERPF